jgi:hypothetical protein
MTGRFAVAALATWRVTHLLAEEDGPFDAIVRARAALGASQAGRLMDCFDCLSLWVAAPLAPRRAGRDRVVGWLALSGAACLIQRMIRAIETEEVEHAVLWEQASGAASGASERAGAPAAGEAPGPPDAGPAGTTAGRAAAPARPAPLSTAGAR